MNTMALSSSCFSSSLLPPSPPLPLQRHRITLKPSTCSPPYTRAASVSVRGSPLASIYREGLDTVNIAEDVTQVLHQPPYYNSFSPLHYSYKFQKF